MNRLIALAALLSAVPAAAAAATSYSAKPAATPTAQRYVVRDIIWRCGPAACQGATENSRPIVLCQGLAKRAGRLENFIADGQALSAAELAKCNLSARGDKGTQLAQQ